MTIPGSPARPRLQPDKILPDILGFLLYLLLLDPMLRWQFQHPGITALILMGLNIAAMGFAVFSFFSGYADMESLVKFRDSLTKWESAALGLSAFISVLAFFWWLVPFAVIKKMGIRETGWGLGALIYFLVFLGTVAGSIDLSKGLVTRKRRAFQFTSSMISTVFFFFGYACLVMTLQHGPPLSTDARILGIACLLVFYLPLRFFLLLRPPCSRVEYVFFLLLFGYMLYELFTRVG